MSVVLQRILAILGIQQLRHTRRMLHATSTFRQRTYIAYHAGTSHTDAGHCKFYERELPHSRSFALDQESQHMCRISLPPGRKTLWTSWRYPSMQSPHVPLGRQTNTKHCMSRRITSITRRDKMRNFWQHNIFMQPHAPGL